MNNLQAQRALEVLSSKGFTPIGYKATGAKDALVNLKLLKLLTRIRKTRKGFPNRALPLIPTHLGIRPCKICGVEDRWPHSTPFNRSRHAHYLRLYRARAARWRGKTPQERRDAVSAARLVAARRHHNRWIEALRRADPLRLAHLERTQGRDGVLAFWRQLSLRRQKQLLRAVPPAPKRPYKGGWGKTPDVDRVYLNALAVDAFGVVPKGKNS